MNIKPKQYAVALYESLQDAKSGEAKLVVGKLVKILAENNDISKIDKIIASFQKIWNIEKGIIDLEIESARELDKTTLLDIEGYVREISQAEQIVVAKKINPAVLGGAIFRYGDKVMDAGVKGRVAALKDAIKK